LYGRNILYFRRYYRLVAAATAATVAVIAGSLLVGESVRFTLAKRVGERLGSAQTVIFSRTSFIDSSMLREGALGGARGVLLSNGFVSAAGRLIPVMVWGVDDKDIPAGGAKVNPALAEELAAGGGGGDVVLRLPAAGLTPPGSLFVTSRYTTSMRLAPAGVLPPENGGNLSLKNEQIIPFNIFVNREELADAMDVAGRVNLIMADRRITADELNRAWRYDFSGIKVARQGGGVEVTSDRIFLQDEVVQAIRRRNSSANRLFSYMVNSIALGAKSIPYSFVTAAERYGGAPLQKDEIILSAYAAERLGAKVNDLVQLAYYTSRDLKTLSIDTVKLRVRQVAPLSVFCADSTLSADFPGLSDVESCTDWDSDLPINMQLVTKEDERYWDLYRTTPKAIAAYDAVAGSWSNAYGSATAIRVDNSKADLSDLRFGMFGLQLIYPREAGIYAAANGVDFSSLFLSLGFFVIVSAALLMLTPLSEMLYRRRGEVALLRALGYTERRVARLLWREVAPVALAASVVGALLGLLYTSVVVWLLGNVWRGATHAGGFSVFPSAGAMVAGLLAGAGISILLARLAVRRALKDAVRRSSATANVSSKKSLRLALLLSLPAVAAALVGFTVVQSAALLVVAGAMLLAAATLWGSYIVCRNRAACGAPSGVFRDAALIWAPIFAARRQALVAFLTLAVSVFIVFAVGLHRQDFSDSSQLESGTGGYALWCESAAPVYHSLATPEGRAKLALAALPANAEALQCLRYGADDASCLNLHRVSTPTVLGVDMVKLAESRFEVAQAIYPAEDRAAFFAAMKARAGNVYPALVDEETLRWSLGLKLGDTLRYETGSGGEVLVRLTGALKSSVFQGSLLIDRRLFAEAWREVAGSEVMLLKVADAELPATKRLLEQALSEYGVRVSATADRLRELGSVADAYLTIFMTLGGLGLLLGLVGFAVAVRKNLAARSEEVALYQTLGFPRAKVAAVLYRENLMSPLYALAAGTACALLSVGASLASVGAGLLLMAALLLALFAAILLLFVKMAVKEELRAKSFSVKNPATCKLQDLQ
jgi:putative ABC transport system permease protein